jgi:hypothetical protein
MRRDPGATRTLPARRRTVTGKQALAVSAAVLATLLSVAPTADGRGRPCANTYGGDVISATSISCREARHIVRTWAGGYSRDGRANRFVEGFRCRGRNDRFEGLTITCRRGNARVGFYANVP